MIAKMSNLKDQIGMQEIRPIMLCEYCGAEYSANKSDYWYLPKDYTFTCCNEPMQIVAKHTIYRRVLA